MLYQCIEKVLVMILDYYSFSMAKTKSRYIITYGLASYFLQYLQDEEKASPYHVTLYDGSFNGMLHFGQIDFLIRFWHES